MNKAIGGVTRGCGRRVEGGIYSEVGTSKDGKPVEHFLLCPPILINAKEYGLSPRGVQLIKDPARNVWHIWDWVGSTYYPNVTDFIEEVRLFGMSRRLSKKIDFSKLSESSRHVLLHTTAHINDPEQYHAERIGGHNMGMDWDNCPKGIHRSDYDGMCAGLWWEDVLDVHESEGFPRMGRREMPSFQYTACKPPFIPVSDHSLAIFASFPISRLVVVGAPDGSHQESLDLAKGSSLPVEIVGE